MGQDQDGILSDSVSIVWILDHSIVASIQFVADFGKWAEIEVRIGGFHVPVYC